jgi:hypothetical protein
MWGGLAPLPPCSGVFPDIAVPCGTTPRILGLDTRPVGASTVRTGQETKAFRPAPVAVSF